MLGPQRPQSADQSLHAPRPRPKTIAAATTEMMWAVALAATRASVASTAHGLALWSRVLRSPITPWSMVASPLAGGSDPPIDAPVISADSTAAARTSAQATAGTTAPANAPGEDAAAFASYRSSGGHAAAQVITHH
jgi:hypothetical protein